MGKLDIKLAYSAGFIEADGCFQITNSGIGVRITNVHLPTLERFVNWFGGNISAKGKPVDCWNWNLHGEKAAELCKDLLPYLSMKKGAAKCLIEFQETVGARGRYISPKVKALREDIRSRLLETRNYR